MRVKDALHQSLNETAVLRLGSVTIQVANEVGEEFSGYVTRYYFVDEDRPLVHRDRTWERWESGHDTITGSDEWEPV